MFCTDCFSSIFTAFDHLSRSLIAFLWVSQVYDLYTQRFTMIGLNPCQGCHNNPLEFLLIKSGDSRQTAADCNRISGLFFELKPQTRQGGHDGLAKTWPRQLISCRSDRVRASIIWSRGELCYVSSRWQPWKPGNWRITRLFGQVPPCLALLPLSDSKQAPCGAMIIFFSMKNCDFPPRKNEFTVTVCLRPVGSSPSVRKSLFN